MADLTKATVLGFDADGLMRCVIVKGDDLKAGEALGEQDACYISSDGLVYKAVTTQTTLSGVSDFDGLAFKVYASGDPVTLVGRGGISEYSSSMTPGALLYVSDTAGKIADAIVLATDEAIAKVLEDNRILIIR